MVERNKSDERLAGHWCELLTAVGIVWLLGWIPVIGAWLGIWGNDAAGQFGDAFGSVNALFSGLALGGIIYAILLQRQELVLQRTELELTRNELAGTRAAQERIQAVSHASARLAALTAVLDCTLKRVSFQEKALQKLLEKGIIVGRPEGKKQEESIATARARLNREQAKSEECESEMEAILAELRRED